MGQTWSLPFFVASLTDFHYFASPFWPIYRFLFFSDHNIVSIHTHILYVYIHTHIYVHMPAASGSIQPILKQATTTGKDRGPKGQGQKLHKEILHNNN